MDSLETGGGSRGIGGAHFGTIWSRWYSIYCHVNCSISGVTVVTLAL